MNNFDEKLDAKINLFLADYYEFEALLKRLPVSVQIELENVTKDIQALSKGLESVPEAFDLEFNRKINKILDLAQEIDTHTQLLERMMQKEIPALLDKHTEALNDVVSDKLKESTQISNTSLICFGVLCAGIGGVISGLLIVAAVYFF